MRNPTLFRTSAFCAIALIVGALAAHAGQRPEVVRAIESKGLTSASPDDVSSIKQDPRLADYLRAAYEFHKVGTPNESTLPGVEASLDRAQILIDGLNQKIASGPNPYQRSPKRIVFKGILVKQFDLYMPPGVKDDPRVREAFLLEMENTVREQNPYVSECRFVDRDGPLPAIRCVVPRIYAFSTSKTREPLIHAMWVRREKSSRGKRGSLGCASLNGSGARGPRVVGTDFLNVNKTRESLMAIQEAMSLLAVPPEDAHKKYCTAIERVLEHVQRDIDDNMKEETVARRDYDQLRTELTEIKIDPAQEKKWNDEIAQLQTRIDQIKSDNDPVKLQQRLKELLKELQLRQSDLRVSMNNVDLQLIEAKKQREKIIDELRNREKDMIFGIIRESVVGISIDKSGSINSGDCIPYSTCLEYAREQVALALRILKPEQKFNIVFTDDGNGSKMFASAVPATQENVEEAIRQLKHGSGGAISVPQSPNGEETLATVFREMESDHPDRIYAFTDGDWGGSESIAARRGQPQVRLTVKKLLNGDSGSGVDNLNAHLSGSNDRYIPSGTAAIPADVIALIEKSEEIAKTILELRKIQSQNQQAVDDIQTQVDALKAKIEEAKHPSPNSAANQQIASLQSDIQATLGAINRAQEKVNGQIAQKNVELKNSEDAVNKIIEARKAFEEDQARLRERMLKAQAEAEEVARKQVEAKAKKKAR